MTLSQLGWNSVYEEAWQKKERSTHFAARVIEVHKNTWRLLSASEDFLAQMSGRLRHRLATVEDWPAVGDWVESDGAAIYDVLPRRSKLSRKAAGRRTDEQIVAANMDTVFVVSAIDRDFNLRRLERYLMLIWEGGAQPVIVLNKADLREDVTQFQFEAEAAAPGVPVYPISAQRGFGLEQLEPHLHSGTTVALVGSSGVGKSTLINRLCGFDRQAVNTVSEDGRGRHTTTSRSLVVLPCGALLIDTPGMREIQLWASEENLNHAFDEIERLASECRFRDCRHVAEPGCAVLTALNDGDVSNGRYDSYIKLRKELAFLERKQDMSAELELKRKWKRLHKANRAMYRMRNKS
ncbi:MAG: ribosome small subunit-dependent GTPase A [Acidobacteria bacterium]|nr:MAG: ribosome small subunit-dependent GTPase A [Acidobacteriota bacterium]